MSIDLVALGFTKEELQERVIQACVSKIFEVTSLDYDEEGDEYAVIESSPMAQRLEKTIKEAIDKKVTEIADKHVLPLAENFIENLVLQQTNAWGEKTGAPKTFIEYLISRADAYLTEPVNHAGKTQAEDSYSWRKNTTRVSYMIDSYLQYHISTAMTAAVANANQSIIEGLNEAVKIRLGEISVQLKTEVKAK